MGMIVWLRGRRGMRSHTMIYPYFSFLPELQGGHTTPDSKGQHACQRQESVPVRRA